MKEAIQQYIEELEERVKFFKYDIERLPQILNVFDKKYLEQAEVVIGELNSVVRALKGIVGGEDKKPLSKNDQIDTEETKTENWRLTKYPT